MKWSWPGRGVLGIRPGPLLRRTERMEVGAHEHGEESAPAAKHVKNWRQPAADAHIVLSATISRAQRLALGFA